MKMKLLIIALLAASVPCAFAQNGPGPAPGDQNPAPIERLHDRHDGGKPEDRGRGMEGHGEMHGGEMHGAMGMLPEGTWWRNPEMAARIGLTPEQVKRIDDIFLQSRVQLIHMHASLEEEQLLLEPLMDANPVDQGKALAQISKIADTRADLEKTNAKMLLGIRSVLNADQWTKLQDRHHGMRGGKEMGGPRGAMGQGPMGQGPMGRAPGGQPGGSAPPQ